MNYSKDLISIAHQVCELAMRGALLGRQTLTDLSILVHNGCNSTLKFDWGQGRNESKILVPGLGSWLEVHNPAMIHDISGKVAKAQMKLKS